MTVILQNSLASRRELGILPSISEETAAHFGGSGERNAARQTSVGILGFR
jgi:hypothetical protein